MKPKYFILSGQDFVATVYDRDNIRIIVVNNPKLQFDGEIQFRDAMGARVEDDPVKSMIMDLIFQKG